MNTENSQNNSSLLREYDPSLRHFGGVICVDPPSVGLLRGNWCTTHTTLATFIQHGRIQATNIATELLTFRAVIVSPTYEINVWCISALTGYALMFRSNRSQLAEIGTLVNCQWQLTICIGSDLLWDRSVLSALQFLYSATIPLWFF